ncbi:hypothetical protein LV75_003010 [Actinokineospora diospyrosa]|uniref:Uncharacterized protein n=1 Tax=Actinokineospora diospyrosa TaxID=103728 RepID=A0ABT1ID26_9PSEU|nr:hypothetical protein [Actinokineospora diospyrosa]
MGRKRPSSRSTASREPSREMPTTRPSRASVQSASATNRDDNAATNWTYTISTWGRTARAVIIAVVVVGIVMLALWLLQVDLVVGPVEITGRAGSS